MCEYLQNALGYLADLFAEGNAKVKLMLHDVLEALLIFLILA
jgi:hypothetical protein